MMKALRPIALALALSFAAGCEDVPDKPPAIFVSMFTLRGWSDINKPTFGEGGDQVFKGGFPTNYFVEKEKIRVAIAHTEGRQSAYMTTDIWVNYPAVWIQPLYILVSEDGMTPPRWVFSVGPESKFYSPFWRVYRVTVPAGVPLEKYSSVRDILADELTVTPGPGRLAAMVPTGMRPHTTAETFLFPDLLGPEGTGLDRSFKVNTGWLDGEPYEYIDFGDNRFEWNERGEIVEQPLFFFFGKDGNGVSVPLPALPRVGGTGPLYERRPPIAPGNRPLFGSFWRLWAVRMPQAARVFVPQTLSKREADAWEKRLWNEPPPPEKALPEGVFLRVKDDEALQKRVNPHAFKVVLNPNCLDDVSTFDDCVWLDSQAALEAHIPRGDLLRSEILVSCPYLALSPEQVVKL